MFHLPATFIVQVRNWGAGDAPKNVSALVFQSRPSGTEDEEVDISWVAPCTQQA